MPVLTPRLVRVLGVTAAAAVVLAVVATFAFSNQARPGRTASAETSPTASAQPADAAATADAGTAGQGTAPGDTDTGTGTDSSNTRPTTAPPTGPWIVYFKVIKKPKCANQDDNVLIIGWKATGADSVALSVDNPELVGGYRKGYKLEDTETFNLSCAPGRTEKHTYTINTVGGGPSKRAQFQVTVAPPAPPTPTPTPTAAAQ